MKYINAQPKIVLVTSAKGGVGKSTVAANLAFAMSRRGNRVLLIDCDYTNRALDLMLGCEDRVVFDFGDIALGRTPPSHALLELEGRFTFAAAPMGEDPVEAGPERIREAVLALAGAAFAGISESELISRCRVVVDTSGIYIPAALASISKAALVVTGQAPASVRAAERTGGLLIDAGAKRPCLVVNDFDFAGAESGARAGIVSLIDSCCLPLLGAIPHDSALALAAEKGELGGEVNAVSKAAFENIAARLDGENVPLLHGLRQFRRRKRFF